MSETTPRPPTRTDAELLRATPRRIAAWYRELDLYARSLPDDVRWTLGSEFRRLKTAFYVAFEAPR